MLCLQALDANGNGPFAQPLPAGLWELTAPLACISREEGRANLAPAAPTLQKLMLVGRCWSCPLVIGIHICALMWSLLARRRNRLSLPAMRAVCALCAMLHGCGTSSKRGVASVLSCRACSPAALRRNILAAKLPELVSCLPALAHLNFDLSARRVDRGEDEEEDAGDDE